MNRHIFSFVKIPEDIVLVLILCAAVLVGGLGFFPGLIDSNVTASATLVVLSVSTGLVLLAYRVMCRLINKTFRPVEIEDVLKPYEDHVDELRRSIASSEEVWILSRTGLGLLRDFEEEFASLLKKNRANRFLVLKPDGKAYTAYQETAQQVWNGNYPKHLETLAGNRAVRLKVIDYPPPVDSAVF